MQRHQSLCCSGLKTLSVLLLIILCAACSSRAASGSQSEPQSSSLTSESPEARLVASEPPAGTSVALPGQGDNADKDKENLIGNIRTLMVATPLLRSTTEPKEVKVARLLMDFRKSSMNEDACRKFTKALADNDLDLKDVQKARTLIEDASHSTPDIHDTFLGEKYAEGGSTVEEAFGNYRRQTTMRAIDKVVSAFQGHGGGALLYLGGVGSWCKEKLNTKTLTFYADIDFCFASSDQNLAVQMRKLYDTIIFEETDGLTASKFDSLCTAHGRATPEVFLGEGGRIYGDEALKKLGILKKIDLETGKIDESPIDREAVIKDLALKHVTEEAKRTGVERFHCNTEPGLSIEMARHLNKDIIQPKIYSTIDSILKGAKYLSRSSEALKSVQLTPEDKNLADFATAITNAKDGENFAEMKNLLTEHFSYSLVLIDSGGKPQARLEPNRATVADFLDKCSKACWSDARRAFDVSVSDIRYRIANLEKSSAGEGSDASAVHDLRSRMTALIDTAKLEIEACASDNVEVPEEIKKMATGVEAESNKFLTSCNAEPIREEELPNLQRLREMIKSGKGPLQKTAITVMTDKLSLMLEAGEAGFQKLNRYADYFSDVLGDLHGSSEVGFEEYLNEIRAQTSPEAAASGSVLGSINSLRAKAASVIRRSNIYMNNQLNATAARHGAMTAFVGINLAVEAKDYYNAFCHGGPYEFATEYFRRRIPGGAVLDAYYQDNYFRCGREIVYLLLPPTAIAEGFLGMLEAAKGFASEKLQERYYDAAVQALFKGATFEHLGTGRGWRLVSVSYNCPDSGTITLPRKDAYKLPEQCKSLYEIIAPQVKHYRVLSVMEDMLDNKAVSSGHGYSWPYEYTGLSKYGEALQNRYNNKVNELVKDYFTGVIEALERRKDYSQGGAATIARIQRDLGCQSPLVDLSNDMSEQEIARCDEIVCTYDELKRCNAELRGLKEKWNAPFVLEYSPQCSLESINECLQNARRELSKQNAAVKRAQKEVADILGIEKAQKIENTRQLTRSRMGMESYPEDSDDHRYWLLTYQEELDRLKQLAALRTDDGTPSSQDQNNPTNTMSLTGSDTSNARPTLNQSGNPDAVAAMTQSGNPAGQSATPDGQSAPPDGQSAPPAGQSATPDGQSASPAGQSFSPPAQSFSPPGQSFSPARQSFSSARQSANPSGQTGKQPDSFAQSSSQNIKPGITPQTKASPSKVDLSKVLGFDINMPARRPLNAPSVVPSSVIQSTPSTAPTDPGTVMAAATLDGPGQILHQASASSDTRKYLQQEPLKLAATLSIVPRQVYYGQSLNVSVSVPAQGATLQTGQSAGTCNVESITWISSYPGITFASLETKATSNNVTFTKMGPVKIWARVKASAGEVETPQVETTVIAPAFSIKFDPASGAKPGQEVKATVLSQPHVNDQGITFRWDSPPGNNRLPYSRNSGVIGFKLGAVPSMDLRVNAIVPVTGETIKDSICASYTGSTYVVKAQVIESGLNPLAWDPVNKKLVETAKGTHAVDEQVQVKATLEGEPPPKTVRWSWETNEGTSIGNSVSQTPTISRHEPGTAEAKVTAMNEDGIVLGTATVSFSVSNTTERSNVRSLKVTLSSERSTLSPGQSTRLTTQVSGGTPPYSYSWQGAAPEGSMSSAIFTANATGRKVLSVTVRDSRGQRGSADTAISVAEISRFPGVLGDGLEVVETTSTVYRGTWRRRAGTDIFDAVWNGIYRDVIELESVNDRTIVFHRHGNNGRYTGILSADGRTIHGSATWYQANQHWDASVGIGSTPPVVANVQGSIPGSKITSPSQTSNTAGSPPRNSAQVQSSGSSRADTSPGRSNQINAASNSGGSATSSPTSSASSSSKFPGVLANGLEVVETSSSVYRGTWTRRPGTDIFDAIWNGIYKDVIELESVNDRSIVLHRRGNNGRYTGIISVDGRTIHGTASWYQGNQHWDASVGVGGTPPVSSNAQVKRPGDTVTAATKANNNAGSQNVPTPGRSKQEWLSIAQQKELSNDIKGALSAYKEALLLSPDDLPLGKKVLQLVSRLALSETLVSTPLPGQHAGTTTQTSNPGSLSRNSLPAHTRQQDGVAFDGQYAGQFTGKASGSITFKISQDRVSGSIKGSMDGDTILGDFNGSINHAGIIDTTLNGNLISNSGVKGTFPYNGTVTGAVSRGAGSGNWSGKNRWSAPSGTWTASKDSQDPPRK